MIVTLCLVHKETLYLLAGIPCSKWKERKQCSTMLIVYLYFFHTFEHPKMFLNILGCHFCTLLRVTSACLLSLYWNYSSTHTISDFVSTDEWFTVQYKRVNHVRTPNGPSQEFIRQACVPATTCICRCSDRNDQIQLRSTLVWLTWF